MSKLFYCYVGQSASTGEPHPVTGRMNMYGTVIAFTTLEKRNHFVDEFVDHNNPSVYAEKCSAKTARQYNLGMLVRDFDEHMEQVVNFNADEYYNRLFYNRRIPHE